MPVSSEWVKDVTALRDELKTRIAEMNALDVAGNPEAENELGMQVAEMLLRRHPHEVATVLMTTMLELVLAEQLHVDKDVYIGQLEASLRSVEHPTVIPADPLVDKIDTFLANPASGVRRDLPKRRRVEPQGVMYGDHGTQSNTFYGNGKSRDV